MKSETIIKVDNLTKVFKLPHEKLSTAKQHFVNLFSQKGYEKFLALDGISFEIKKGEFFGIIGSNGSGKSTLLKILAGIYQPTSGNVEINGSLSPFIELGVGFNPELSARDNVFLNAAILGLTKKQTEEKFEEIVEFSELKEFMDQKLKNFSSGMQVRLAFSIAIHAQADILLIDEVLAVGDVAFQQKCFEVFRELKREKRTIIFVSHSLSVIEQFCDRVALINRSKLMKIGEPRNVINDYLSIVSETEASTIELNQKKAQEDKEERWGDGKVKIKETWIEDNGRKSLIVKGKNFDVVVEYVFYETAEDPVFGIIFRDETLREVFLTNTDWENIKTGKFQKGSKITVRFGIENVFDGGSYLISPAVASKNGVNFHDWRNNFRKFIIQKTPKTGGVVNIPVSIEINSV